MKPKVKRYIKEAELYFLANNKEPTAEQLFGYLDLNVIPCCSLYPADAADLRLGLSRMIKDNVSQLELFPE